MVVLARYRYRYQNWCSLTKLQNLITKLSQILHTEVNNRAAFKGGGEGHLPTQAGSCPLQKFRKLYIMYVKAPSTVLHLAPLHSNLPLPGVFSGFSPVIVQFVPTRFIFAGLAYHTDSPASNRQLVLVQDEAQINDPQTLQASQF